MDTAKHSSYIEKSFSLDNILDNSTIYNQENIKKVEFKKIVQANNILHNSAINNQRNLYLRQ